MAMPGDCARSGTGMKRASAACAMPVKEVKRTGALPMTCLTLPVPLLRENTRCATSGVIVLRWLRCMNELPHFEVTGPKASETNVVNTSCPARPEQGELEKDCFARNRNKIVPSP